VRRNEPGYVDRGHDPDLHAAAAMARHGFTKRSEDVVLPPESGGGDVLRAIWRDNVHGGKVLNPGTDDVGPVARGDQAESRDGRGAEHLAAGNLGLKRKRLWRTRHHERRQGRGTTVRRLQIRTLYLTTTQKAPFLPTMRFGAIDEVEC